jgi:hypothetical protein
MGGKGKEKASVATAEHNAAANIEALGSSICLFLYEVGPSPNRKPGMKASPESTKRITSTAEKGAWKKIIGGNTHLVKERGPSNYRSFPEHHFFTRLYRVEAVSI